MNKLGILSATIRTLIYLGGSAGIVLTFLPFLKFNNWWIRVGEFPRLQIALACLFSAAALLFFYRTFAVYDLAFLILLVFCTSYQFYCIVPYTPVYQKQVELSREAVPEKTVRLLISNVLVENEDYRSLLDLVEEVRPDMVLLCESDQRWLNNVAPLKENYPHFVEKPMENGYGIALYSRLELVDPQVKFVIEDDIPSIHTDVRLDSGEVVRLYGLHPRPPVPAESDETTDRDAELIVVGKEIKGRDRPTIVAGDLNDVAWSRTTSLFQKISGLLDPRIGRGMYSSFHADYPFIRFPLDHVFHSEHFRLVELKRLRSIGSDHFPIYIKLSLENSAKITQEPPAANREEKKEANRVVKEAEEK